MSSRLKTSLLKEYIHGLLAEAEGQRKLRVFDFDDTLVKTDAKTVVTHGDGSTDELTPGQLAVYEAKPSDSFDYTQFHAPVLINPRQIKWTGKILNSIYMKYGPGGFVILTARGVTVPIESFLEDAGFPGVEVIGLNCTDPKAKAAWIQQRMVRDRLTYLEFFDDSQKNVNAVAALSNANVESATHSVNYGGNTIWVATLKVNHPERKSLRPQAAQRP